LSTASGHYLNRRVLKLNAGFLLSEAIGALHESRLDIPEPIATEDDLVLHSISGPLRLSRTREGILVQAHLDVVADNQCARCLDTMPQPVHLDIEELYALHSEIEADFMISADGILDLAPLLRMETILETSWPFRAEIDPDGVCQACGRNIHQLLRHDDGSDIDPRLARLADLLGKEDK
jgi:uncharacterized protein